MCVSKPRPRLSLILRPENPEGRDSQLSYIFQGSPNLSGVRTKAIGRNINRCGISEEKAGFPLLPLCLKASRPFLMP
jgi:hypothetical protein